MVFTRSNCHYQEVSHRFKTSAHHGGNCSQHALNFEQHLKRRGTKHGLRVSEFLIVGLILRRYLVSDVKEYSEKSREHQNQSLTGLKLGQLEGGFHAQFLQKGCWNYNHNQPVCRRLKPSAYHGGNCSKHNLKFKQHLKRRETKPGLRV